MKVCIGIVSYLPDNKFREIRYERCKKLISQLNSIFDIQIIIIEQNYRDLPLNGENLIEYKFDEKLGIPKARQILRKKFLESNFDYIILFDDDAEVIGSYEDGQLFLKELNDHPNTFFSQKGGLFCGFCVSRKLFEVIDIPNLNAEKDEGYEDLAFFRIIRKIVQCDRISIETNLEFKHNYTKSTWANKENSKNNDLRMQRTLLYIDEQLKKYDKLPLLKD
jgi:hypothetical protein